MKVLLKVHGSEESGWVQSQYGYIHLRPRSAQGLLRKRETFRLAKVADRDLYRVTYWGSHVNWFGSPARSLDHRQYPKSWNVDDYGDPAEAFLRRVLDDAKLRALNNGCGPQAMPPRFRVPTYLLDATECNMVDVLDDGILCKSYPKHCDHQQQTDVISWELIEQAAQAASRARISSEPVPVLPLAANPPTN